MGHATISLFKVQSLASFVASFCITFIAYHSYWCTHHDLQQDNLHAAICQTFLVPDVLFCTVSPRVHYMASEPILASFSALWKEIGPRLRKTITGWINTIWSTGRDWGNITVNLTKLMALLQICLGMIWSQILGPLEQTSPPNDTTSLLELPGRGLHAHHVESQRRRRHARRFQMLPPSSTANITPNFPMNTHCYQYTINCHQLCTRKNKRSKETRFCFAPDYQRPIHYSTRAVLIVIFLLNAGDTSLFMSSNGFPQFFIIILRLLQFLYSASIGHQCSSLRLFSSVLTIFHPVSMVFGDFLHRSLAFIYIL